MYSAFLLLAFPSIVSAYYDVRIASAYSTGQCLSTTSDGKTLQMVDCPSPSVSNWEFNDQEALTAIRWPPTNTCIYVDGNNRVFSKQCDGSLNFNVHFPNIKYGNQCLVVQDRGVALGGCGPSYPASAWYMA